LEDGITYEQVLEVNQIIRESSQGLWKFVLAMIEESVSKGYLPRAGKAAEGS
jgi:hypothetical protein